MKQKIESILLIVVLSSLGISLLILSEIRDHARNAKFNECLKVSNEVEYLKECMN